MSKSELSLSFEEFLEDVKASIPISLFFCGNIQDLVRRENFQICHNFIFIIFLKKYFALLFQDPCPSSESDLSLSGEDTIDERNFRRLQVLRTGRNNFYKFLKYLLTSRTAWIS